MRAAKFAVVFPEGEAGDEIVRGIRARLDVDGLEALCIAKERLEIAGPPAGAVVGVLDGDIELAIERLGTGGWSLLLACRRTQQRVWVLGVVRALALRPLLERTARRAFALPHAVLEWIE